MAQLTVDFTFSPDNAYAGKTIQFSSQVSGGSAGKYVYDWDFNDGTAHSNLSNPTHVYDISGCGIHSFQVLLTVTDTSTNSTGSKTKSVHVKKIHAPPPTVNFQFSPDYVCSGTPIQFTSTVTGCDSNLFVYIWNFDDGSLTSPEKNPVHSFNSFGCGTHNYNVVLIICDTSNNSTVFQSATHAVHINSRPDPQLTDEANDIDFSNCYNNPPPTPSNPEFRVMVMNVTQNVTCIVSNSYSINWGDGHDTSGLNNVSFPIEHIYQQLGSFNLSFKAEGTNGCLGETVYLVKNEANPGIGVTSLGSTLGCTPITFPFNVRQFANNSPFTTYTWDFDDGTSPIIWTNDSIYLNDSIIYHTFTRSSCLDPEGTFTVKLTATNSCKSTVATVGGIEVWDKGITMISDTLPGGCAGQCIWFINTSTIGFGPGCVQSTNFYWDFGNSNTYQGNNPPCQVYNTPGTYILTLIGSSHCGNDTLICPVEIDSLPSVNVVMNSTNDCLPKEISFTNHSSGGNLSYSWEITPSTGWTFTNNTNFHSPEPQIMFTTYSPTGYVVKLTVNNDCISTDDTTFTIPVKDKPGIILEAPPQGMCSPFKYKPQATYSPNNSSINLYQWSFEGGIPDTSNLENPDSVLYSSAGIFRIIARATNECGTSPLTDSIKIMEYLPVTITSSDTSVCLNSPVFKLNAIPADGIWSGNIVNPAGWINPSVPGTFKCRYVRGTGNCESKDSMYVTVNSLPGVYAGVDRGYCIDDDPVNLMELGASCTNQPLWTGAGITDQLLGTFNPGLAGTGVFVISLRCTDAVTTCSNTDNVNITVDDFPQAAFIADTFCVGISKQFENISTGAYSYLWDFNDGTTSTESSPYHVFASTGVYQVRLIVNTRFGCADTLEHFIQVTETPAEPAFTFTCDPPNQCSPVTVNIHFDHSMYDNFVKYRWNFGNGSVLNPSGYSFTDTTITYVKGIIADTSYQLTVQVLNTCGTLSKSQTIMVHAPARAEFVTDFHKNCSPMHINISNTSIGYPDYFIWDFGDGTPHDTTYTKTLFEHIYYYDGKTDTAYCIKLVAVNTCGHDTITDSVYVYPNTVTAFIASGETYGCPPLTVNFNGEGSLGCSIYNWNFGDGNVSNEKNPTHIYVLPGIYRAHLLVTVLDTCSIDTISTQIVVYSKPELNFSINPDSVCCGNAITFENLSGDLANMVWDFGDSTYSSLTNPTHIYANPGVYQVKMIGTGTLFDCVDTLSKNVYVKEKPKAEILTDTSGCVPLSVTFTGDMNSYHLWNFGDNTTFTSNPTYVFESPGLFTVTLISENSNMCRDTNSREIRVFPIPESQFTFTSSGGYPAALTFVNTSTGATQCMWDFGNGQVSTSCDVNEPIKYNRSDNYTIILVTSNLYGCSDTSTVVYPVSFQGLFVPNAFAPEQFDPGVNLFLPKGIGIFEYTIQVFDTWGNVIWQSSALNEGSPSEGWDGKDINGKPYPQDVYVWKATAKFIDGTYWSGENGKNTGTVTLIR